MLTVAWGIAAPLESLMVPTMVPVNDWASVMDGARISPTAMTMRVKRMVLSSRWQHYTPRRSSRDPVISVDAMSRDAAVTYTSYLQIDALLSLQQPRSA